MIEIDLPEVTLVCVDCLNTSRAILVMQHCKRLCRFGSSVLYTSLPVTSDADIRVVSIPHIGSRDAVNPWMLGHLADAVETKYLMNIQYDGFIANPEAWTDQFLAYDYIGAIWPKGVYSWTRTESICGNGGFSIRTKRLQQWVAENGSSWRGSEDMAICIEHRNQVESAGFTFAPTKLADTFSAETSKYSGQFGFHGLKTMKTLVEKYWFPNDSLSRSTMDFSPRIRRFLMR